jgi:monovalent cation:H+ antiporter-2, CPA2 family
LARRNTSAGATSLAARLVGKPREIAVAVGAAFFQVGELSYIFRSVARELGLIDWAGWNALVAGSIVSIALNPTWSRWARRWASRTTLRAVSSAADASPVNPQSRILVGFGPVGRIVHRLLSAQAYQVHVVDLNLETVRALKAQGHSALYRDVLRPRTLLEAGILSAGSLVLSADVDDAEEIVRYSRALNPKLVILVRCAHLRDVKAL